MSCPSEKADGFMTFCSDIFSASGRGCEMDQTLFEAPRGYSVVGSYRESMREEEDDLLQFAIQQSLLEAGSEYDQVKWLHHRKQLQGMGEVGFTSS